MKKLTIYEMTTCAIFAALLCVISPFTLPIGPINLSLCTLILYFAVMLIGTRGATISCLVYILLGMVGLPVFQGFSSGIQKLAGPTGGYIVGYVLITLISGLFYRNGKSKKWVTVLGMIVATAALYALGTVWFMLLMKCSFAYAMTICVIPFIPGDIVKIIVAVLLGSLIRQALLKQNLIPETFLS